MMNDKLLLHDSETLKHIQKVRENIMKLVFELDDRAQKHDKSKLESPEREIFAEVPATELAKCRYASPEYHSLLDKLKPALDHHYAKNRHHPNHFVNGIEEMDLVDLLEMLCDWLAATERNKDGNIHNSIKINTQRHNISPQLSKILSNTVNRYF